MQPEHKPYIPASTILPEITVKAIVLAIVLSAILGAANAYMGLFLGMTVSASIPAAVMSMAILRMFRSSNILENNGVQTAASSGEALAAGVIFTLPALILMQYWTEFNYWETTLIAGCGGVLGVFFTIPLRNALIVKEQLMFPEGLATAEVLKAGTEGGSFMKYLLVGSALGGGIKLFIEGFKLWPGTFEASALVKGKGFLYFGTYLTPAVMAVGYIVGLNISLLVILGGAITWYVGIPTHIAINGVPEGTELMDHAGWLYKYQIRYLGVGAMIVGGLWAIISIRKSLASAVREGIAAFKRGKDHHSTILRTEYDMPIQWIMIGIGVLIVPIFIIYWRQIEMLHISIFMTILMFIGGFVFSAVAGYMAGLVGSSNNPISGVTIATILSSALILAALLGTDSPVGAASAIMIGAVVCCAAAIAGDNMQDLKSGYELGATPKYQQYMQIIGVVTAAFVMAPVLNLLNNAYTIGSDDLPAPQSTLMMSVAQGVFGGELPWAYIYGGMGIGAVIIVIDQLLARRGSNFRMPVLAVAVGMYLPMYLDTAIFFGGLIAWLVDRYFKKQSLVTADRTSAKLDIPNANIELETRKGNAEKAGLLFASGLITGEALLGVALAIPFGISEKKDDALKLIDNPLPDWIGLGIFLACCSGLYYAVVKSK
jgi:putative OPT family oligopeptide transporter